MSAKCSIMVRLAARLTQITVQSQHTKLISGSNLPVASGGQELVMLQLQPSLQTKPPQQTSLKYSTLSDTAAAAGAQAFSGLHHKVLTVSVIPGPARLTFMMPAGTHRAQPSTHEYIVSTFFL